VVWSRVSVFLFTSHGLRRYEASATLQRVFIRAGPADVCVSCSSPYLRPGGDADLWRRAVRSGFIDDSESIEVFKTLGVRKCAVKEGEDANGTVLGWCLPCYSECRPPARKRRGAQCPSLLTPIFKTKAAVSSGPRPVWPGSERGDRWKDAFNFYQSSSRIHIEQDFGMLSWR